MAMFVEGCTIEEVANTIGRAMSTTSNYLQEYVEQQRPDRIDPWVDDDRYNRIVQAAAELGADRLRPIFEYFEEAVPYEQLKLVLTHHRVTHSEE